MSSFSTQKLARFVSLGYLFRISINFTATQHLSVMYSDALCPYSKSETIWMDASHLLRMLRSSVDKLVKEYTGASWEPTAAEKSHWWKYESMQTSLPLSSKKLLQGRLGKGHDTFHAVTPRASQRSYCVRSWWRQYWDFLMHREKKYTMPLCK